jgi:hypothetical protein
MSAVHVTIIPLFPRGDPSLLPPDRVHEQLALPSILGLLRCTDTSATIEVDLNGTPCQEGEESEVRVFAWCFRQPGDTLRLRYHQRGGRERTWWTRWLDTPPASGEAILGTQGTMAVTMSVQGTSCVIRPVTSEEDASIAERTRVPVPLAASASPEPHPVPARSIQVPAPFQPPQIHSFSLATCTPETVLSILTEVLVHLPPKTVLVDLRPRAARQRSMGVIPKDLLRMVFGARYWDRGEAITTMPRLLPYRAEERRWQTVVSNPNEAEGLPLLIAALQQGYSLVLLDDTPPDMKTSPRAAVEKALHPFLNLAH